MAVLSMFWVHVVYNVTTSAKHRSYMFSSTYFCAGSAYFPQRQGFRSKHHSEISRPTAEGHSYDASASSAWRDMKEPHPTHAAGHEQRGYPERFANPSSAPAVLPERSPSLAAPQHPGGQSSSSAAYLRQHSEGSAGGRAGTILPQAYQQERPEGHHDNNPERGESIWRAF
jgi:hypothetical protein